MIGTRVPVAAAGGPVPVISAGQGGAHLLRVSGGGGPVDFGGDAVAAGAGFSLAAGDAPLPLLIGSGETLYASAAVDSVVQVLAPGQ